MNWKSTAFASGVMLIGTWLASHAPVGSTRQDPTAAPSAARTETAAAEIQREAHRLHERLAQAAAYRQPARNPFRFSERTHAAPPTHAPAITVEDMAPPPSIPAQPTLRLALSGIAEDQIAKDGSTDEIVRTAIISTPDNVFLVAVGDTVAETYKVAAIAADAVELVRIDDGSTVRLTLRP